LFGIKKESNASLSDFNNNLKKYNLYSFQHRITKKIFTFARNVVNDVNSPAELHQVFNQESFLNSRARNPNLILPKIKSHFGEKQFSFFFIKLFNTFGGKKNFYENYNSFLIFFNLNIDNILKKFLETFNIFDLHYKNLEYLNNNVKKNKQKNNYKT